MITVSRILGVETASTLQLLLRYNFFYAPDHGELKLTSLKPSIENISERALNVLTKVPLFCELPDKVQTEISHKIIPRQFPAGQFIYLEGEPAKCVYILEKGWVKATRISPEGREQALMFLRPVEIFGDIAVLAGTSYPCTVMALEDLEVWTIDSVTLLNLVSRQPELAQSLIRHLAKRILYFIDLVEDLTLCSVETRLITTLMKNAEMKNGVLTVPRRTWTTFDEMAARLGTVRDVLSRVLRSLEAESLIKVEREEIVLLDTEGLAKRINPR